MAKPLIVDGNKESNSLQLLPFKPLLSSRSAGWNNIHLANYVLPAYEVPEHLPAQTAIVIHHQSLTVKRNLGGQVQRELIELGEVVVVPAYVSHASSWHEEASFTLLTLEPKFIARTADEFIDPDQVEILPHFAQPDPLIYKIGRQLKSKLESNAQVCQLFVESAASLLAVHLLTHYCGRKHTLGKAPDGLPKTKLRLVIDYINTYLDQNLGLLELAQLVQMSRAHFIRQFKRSVGVAPHQYLIQCRLERAKTLLATTDLNIAEIAQGSGFSSHSHLSRIFHQHLSITPHQYRQGYYVGVYSKN
jgi:AraC family transcriptional regulator